MNLLVTVHLQVMQKGLGKPFTGSEYRVRLYDLDLVQDDFLGEAVPDEHGRVSIVFDPAKAKTADSPFETEPDLYFVLLKNEQALYQSPVVENVSFEPGTTAASGNSYDLGTFLI